MRPFMNPVAMVVAALLCATTATSSTLEHLGQPVRAWNVLAGRLVRDRQSGRELLALSNTNEISGAELLFLDFENNTSRLFRAPAGAGADTFAEVPGDRLVLGTYYDGKVMTFDLNSMMFNPPVGIAGETYVWGFATGSDGRVYFGTYPHAKLGALNPNTNTVEELGSPLPENQYLLRTVAVPDGRILCRFFVVNQKWLVYDPATRAFSPVSDALSAENRAASWKGYIVAGQNAYQGADLHQVKPPPFAFPPPSKRRAVKSFPFSAADPLEVWALDTNLTTPDALYIRRGAELWRLMANQTEFKRLTDVDLHGGLIFGVTADDRIVGVRGQDYFVLKLSDTRLSLAPIPGESNPRGIFFLESDPQGGIWGSPPYAPTLFHYDPGTGTILNTPTISDNSGEIYDVVFLDGVIYAVAYSHGEIIRYDPHQRFDQFNHSNPKTIVSLLNDGYNRPTGGVVVGPDKKLYSGWTAELGDQGGAIAITDPATGQTDLVKDPLGPEPIVGLVSDGQVFYIGGDSPDGAGAVNPSVGARFGIFDPISRMVAWKKELNAGRVRAIGFDSRTHLVVTLVDNHIRLFDPITRTFLDRASNAPMASSWSNSVPGDGKVYYGSGHDVIALDLQSGASEVLTKIAGYVANVTITPDGTLYFGAGADLYRLTK